MWQKALHAKHKWSMLVAKRISPEKRRSFKEELRFKRILNMGNNINFYSNSSPFQVPRDDIKFI